MPFSNQLETQPHLLSNSQKNIHHPPLQQLLCIASYRVLESNMAAKILPTPSQMDNVEAITQSRTQGSCLCPHKSISLHLGGRSEMFVGLSQHPDVPRSSKLVSLGNEMEESDHQSYPPFALTFALTFHLTILGIPLTAGKCEGQGSPHKVSSGPGSTCILTALWARTEEGYMQMPKEGLVGFLLTQHAPLPTCPKGEGTKVGEVPQGTSRLLKPNMFQQKTGQHSAQS